LRRAETHWLKKATSKYFFPLKMCRLLCTFYRKSLPKQKNTASEGSTL
jgi:hypothetical protein